MSIVVLVLASAVGVVLAPSAIAAPRGFERVVCAYGKEIYRRVPVYGPGFGETAERHFSLCLPGEDVGQVISRGVVEPRYGTRWYLVDFDGAVRGRRTGWVTAPDLVWLDRGRGATEAARAGR